MEKAKEYYERALILNPFLTATRIELAKISLRQSEAQKAVNLCLKNLEIVNNDTQTIFLLISIFTSQKDLVNLNKYVSGFIDTQNDPELLTVLGKFLAKNNVPQLARDCFAKAAKLK